MLNLKSGLLLLAVGSISACGGASVDSVQSKLPDVDVASFDTDSDGKLSETEMKSAWASLSTAKQSEIASTLGISLETIDKLFNGEITFAQLIERDTDFVETLRQYFQGKDGADGKDGTDGAKGEKGDAGEDGKDGVDGKNGINGTNGTDGKDGTDGANGADGIDGLDGTSVTVGTDADGNVVLTDGFGNTVTVQVIVGADGKDGQDGVNGKDGVDGTNGEDGKDGTDGVDGTNGTDGVDGTDGTNGIDGTNGTDGQDGVSVTNATVNSSGDLIITLSNGTEINAGSVNTVFEEKEVASVTFSNGHTITNEGRHEAFKDFSRNLSDINYDKLNVAGVEEAHNEGWTGQYITIGVIEVDPYGSHAETVTEIIETVAPGAYVYNAGSPEATNVYDDGFAIYNHSYGKDAAYETTITYDDVYSDYWGNFGWTNSGSYTYSASDIDTFVSAETKEYYKSLLDDNANGLHIAAAGNNGLVRNGDSTDGGTEVSSRTYDGCYYWEQTDIYCTNTYLTTHTYTTYTFTDVELEGDNATASSVSNLKYLFDGTVDTSALIVVGAVGQNLDGSEGSLYELADYSNAAGELLMNDFLVADGSWGDGVVGTSFAAPKVSGAAALVHHKFGTNNVNTKQILLETADDLGEAGVDAVFGHGLLNVERALSPVGHLN